MKIELSQEQIDNLKKLAKRKCWCENDDFSAYDYSGGNYDDAYAGGCSDGESLLAAQLLSELGIDLENKSDA